MSPEGSVSLPDDEFDVDEDGLETDEVVDSFDDLPEDAAGGDADESEHPPEGAEGDSPVLQEDEILG